MVFALYEGEADGQFSPKVPHRPSTRVELEKSRFDARAVKWHVLIAFNFLQCT